MDLLPLLGWLAALMTAVGSYRLTTYLHRQDPLYAVVTGGALALLFIAFFEAILLATGLLTILLPVLYVLTDGEWQLTVPRPDRGAVEQHTERAAAWVRRQIVDGRDRLQRVNGDRRPPGENNGERALGCPRCGNRVNHGDRFCHGCGLTFRWQTRGDRE